MDPQAIVDALAASQPQLTRLAGAISADNGSARALLGPLIDPIAQSIAADGDLSQAIVDSARAPHPPPMAMAPVAIAEGANDQLLEYIGRDSKGPVARELTVKEIFHKDQLLFDRENGRMRDLVDLLDNFDVNTMRQVYLEPHSNRPKIRYAMSKYIETAGTPGPNPLGLNAPNTNLLDPLDRTNLSMFPKFMGVKLGVSKDSNPWKTPDNFIDFRRLKLKKGYRVSSRMNAVNTSSDVYVYYFDKIGTREQQLEIPFDDSNFMIPKGWNAYARYPDGIILYKSPEGVMQAEFPIENTGTYLKTSGDFPPSPYMDIADASVGNQKARIDGLGGITSSEKQLMYQFAAYLGMMQLIKEENAGIRGGNHTNHVTRNRRRRHNKSVKRNKTRTKSKGKSRARAMSMLKSAKRQFHGGYPMNMGGAMGAPYTNISTMRGATPVPMSPQQVL